MTKGNVRIYLIKPSKYDDDGFVLRHWKSSLPSNTLACMHALTHQAVQKGVFGPRDVKIVLLDEAIQRIPVHRIIRQTRRHRVMAALVGVQTNQFPRASDIATRLVEGGVRVIFGGFHVSGSLALFRDTPGEIQALLDKGVTVVAGEAEDAWADILRDVFLERAAPLYNLLDAKPDLSVSPVPFVDRRLGRRYAFPNMGTIDAGRGCPFSCDFCTIINVQGRSMRMRSPDAIAASIRSYYKQGVNFYFFTDDNFSRNPNWRKIFQKLIHLREQEGLNVEFMIQVDTLSYKMKGFIEMAARAGCTQVFIGMESVNPANLHAVGKRQNIVEDYHDLIQACHRHHIATHAGYILGFPNDTYASIMRDVEILKNEVKVDRVSFFILTPLPGSMTHVKMTESRMRMDADFNQYDTFHVVTDHGRMSRDEWWKAYQDAWKSFFSYDNMKAVLQRATHVTYWGNMIQFLWYRNAILHEEHPMMSGMFRLKDYDSRRQGASAMSRWDYCKLRCRDVRRTLKNWWRLLGELESLWLETRRPEYDHITTVRSLTINWGDLWYNLRTFRLKGLVKQGSKKLLGESLWIQHWIGRVVLRSRTHRRDLNTRWRQIAVSIRRNKLAFIHYIHAGFVLLREIPILLSFGSTFMLKTLFDTPSSG